MSTKTRWSLRGLMRRVGALWLVSAVVMLVVFGLKSYNGDGGLSLRLFLIGFGLLALGPALWFLVLVWLIGGDGSDG